MQKQSFIFNFLFSRRYRFWRHLLLIMIFMIMSINQALADYRDILPVLGNRIYLIIAIIFLNYIGIGYLTIYVLAPGFLLKKKYFHFAFCIVLASLAFLIIPNVVTGKYSHIDGLFSNVAILDNISGLFVYILGISGVIVPVFLKNWMSENERVSQLEKNRTSSEVEQLKEQINPASFFNILNRTGTLVKTEPDRASAMLMKLSQLLRYQLYDCNRSQVLLTAEIAFIRNFLEMERLYSPRFNYSIETEGNLVTKFIPPTILLPYVQGVVKAFNNPEEDQRLDILIKIADGEISFVLQISCSYDTELLANELAQLKKRLLLLYKDNYALDITEDKDLPGVAEICLKLYNS